MIKSSRILLPPLLAATGLLLNPACTLLKPRSSAPAITAVRTNQPPGLSARLRENFGVRETPTPAVATAAPAVDAKPASPAPLSAPATNSTATAYKMRAGDGILITLRDLPDRSGSLPVEDVIDDSGCVSLPLIGRMTAVGKTTSAFEQEIEKKYIDEQYYKRLTVNVVIPQRLIFVTGEVKLSNKYPLSSGMTLSQAIATAAGCTDFADRKKIKLIRNGRTTLHNLIEIQLDPSKDITLEAGDQVDVPRSPW